jgi:hypothetical protein
MLQWLGLSGACRNGRSRLTYRASAAPWRRRRGETGYKAEAVRRAMASRRWATASTLRQNARAR